MKLNTKRFERFRSSPQLVSFLKLKAAAIHKEYGITEAAICLDESKDESFVAFTDNFSYHINVGNTAFYEGLSEEEYFKTVMGLLLHEIGHRLFTSFTAMQIWSNEVESGCFFPEDPAAEGDLKDDLEEIKAFMKDKRSAMVLSRAIGLNLMNSLEDGREEMLCLNLLGRHKSLYSGLVFTRKKTFSEAPSFSEVNDLFENGGAEEKLRSLLQMILFYSRFYSIKDLQDDDTNTVLYSEFERIAPTIEEYLTATTAMDLYRAMNDILLSIWKHIRELFSEKENEDPGKSSEDKPSEGDTGEGSGKGSGGGGKGAPGKGPSSMPAPGSSGYEEALAALEALFGEIADESSVPSLSGSGTDGAAMRKRLGGFVPILDTTSIESTGSGLITHEEDERESETKLELGTLLRKIEGELAEEDREAKLKEGIENFAGAIDFPSIHKNVDAVIIREKVTPYEKAEYEKISRPLRKIAEQMARKSRFLEKEEDAEYELNNCYCGTSLNPLAYSREDYKIFKKTIYADPENSISVAVLVDESGSMYGHRVEAAKRAAILLYEYCDIMNIPVSIYGHSTTYRGAVSLYSYADFDRKAPDDRYRLMHIDARSENRDGYALRFMKEKIKAQNTSERILIIISDGQPSAPGYCGSAADKDLSVITKECENEDINLIAAAIGSDKPTIRAIYGDKHFLDISDLDTLHLRLLNLIKAHIKK